MSASGARPKSVQDVRNLLYRRFRVTLVSGRVLEGDFTCLDRQGNIILSNTFEQVTTAPGREGRHMGLVLVPTNQQQKVELQATLEEEMSMLQLVESYAAAPRQEAVA
ncbi:hypothetical protein VOLCADRAFT_116657 [Volvox carteri f. nagariensis]|uniref:Sm domain-containing protein n=1 Tax=Volvox carteri f. nagariensis TaxID=3068 RepID=D8TN56_VOLCA|nr:uncharacterized protein VOLCADRAFT_116657 [Volvox carteri f. nagariensis]EFJ50931.1 hypothetical protein VOLCADRAFT_116657 [Volvox carteri f. nagariensis]|eukprot:XP_002947943.1 hypothetical protein VOLCADRAFT_116657 [Volvox carteri f. nagariensis]